MAGISCAYIDLIETKESMIKNLNRVKNLLHDGEINYEFNNQTKYFEHAKKFVKGIENSPNFHFFDNSDEPASILSILFELCEDVNIEIPKDHGQLARSLPAIFNPFPNSSPLVIGLLGFKEKHHYTVCTGRIIIEKESNSFKNIEIKEIAFRDEIRNIDVENCSISITTEEQTIAKKFNVNIFKLNSLFQFLAIKLPIPSIVKKNYINHYYWINKIVAKYYRRKGDAIRDSDLIFHSKNLRNMLNFFSKFKEDFEDYDKEFKSNIYIMRESRLEGYVSEPSLIFSPIYF